MPSKWVARALALLVAAVALVGMAAAAPAAPPTPADPAGGPELGVVPVLAQGKAKPGGGGQNLVYHGGPVIHANTVYAIYWVPPGYAVSSGYEPIIDGYFANLQAAQNASSNVYWASTQYYDTIGGNILQQSTFAGSVVDTDPLPPSGCTDRYTSVCLTDGQLRQELAHVIAASGLTATRARSSSCSPRPGSEAATAPPARSRSTAPTTRASRAPAPRSCTQTCRTRTRRRATAAAPATPASPRTATSPPTRS